MKKLFEPHYAVEFKRKVIEEYLVTGCSKMSLLAKYDITFKSAIQTWMRILGYTDPYQGIERPKFGNIIFTSVSKGKNKSKAELEDKIRDLERQLEDAKLRSEAYARIIDKAEKEYKIPIRKKPDTR
jgi:hypothetical protein